MNWYKLLINIFPARANMRNIFLKYFWLHLTTKKYIYDFDFMTFSNKCDTQVFVLLMVYYVIRQCVLIVNQYDIYNNIPEYSHFYLFFLCNI